MYVSTFEDKVARRLNRYKALPSMRQKSEEELIDIAKRNVEKEIDKKNPDFDFKTMFKKSEDIGLAEELLDQYLSDFNVSTQADRSTLMQLIQLEVWHRHFSEKIETALHANNKTPKDLLNTIHRNLEQIRELKTALGLGNAEQDSTSGYVTQLIKRGNIWSEKLNKADRTFFCQHCSKPNLLTFKVDKYDPIKHPFFQGRYVTNPKIIKLFLDGTLTKEDVGEIFDTAKIDYVNWLIKKFYTKEHLHKIQQSRETHYKQSFGKDRIPDEKTTDSKEESV